MENKEIKVVEPEEIEVVETEWKKKVEMTRICGYLVEKEIVDFIRFNNIVQMASRLLDRHFILFGSITHYFAWCENNSYLPTEVCTMKTFIGLKRHIPNDLDIYSGNDALTKVFPEAILEGETSRDYRFPHARYSLPNQTLFGDLPVQVDVLKCKKICAPMDFSVNCLSFSKVLGLYLDVDISSFTLLENVDQSRIYADDVDIFQNWSSIHAKCPLIGHCLDCQFFQRRLIKMLTNNISEKTTFLLDVRPTVLRRPIILRRIKKMIDRGFTIVGWDDYFPTRNVRPDENIPCVICKGQISYKGYQLVCGRKFQPDNLLCVDCFWLHLEDQAKKGNCISCPLCRQVDPLFSFASSKRVD